MLLLLNVELEGPSKPILSMLVFSGEGVGEINAFALTISDASFVTFICSIRNRSLLGMGRFQKKRLEHRLTRFDSVHSSGTVYSSRFK